LLSPCPVVDLIEAQYTYVKSSSALGSLKPGYACISFACAAKVDLVSAAPKGVAAKMLQGWL
jgi:hypothetical protein